MTVVAVLADPPRPGLALPDIAESTPLSATDTADLYAATLKDTLRAVERSGGDLLVNYRPDDLLSDEHVTDTSSEAELRALAGEALEDVTDARFEQQVGSTHSARAGNTATHLLREEGVDSVAVTRGTTPLLTRTVIDSAAMKLRGNQTVLGPSTRGRTYYAGFTAPIDYEAAFEGPELETLVDRAGDAGHRVEFLPTHVGVETAADLRDLLPVLWSRIAAERVVPERTATFVHEHGLRVRDGDVVVDD
ncbi:hypothetical protein Hbl1158_09290 [Halobaculum sp. CBA1158]|uniref:TIGR04282 family arsenosugar biosynthesis glycosyltransferase n=1 Tax=Halobaculum sp. CBA1158 TaxID=2904243 RepID=UPI001F2AAB3F|nr:hypothetical protein [Halobaculum sp. CBA1158]UIO98738.1 hypothetical protein Hbl1158_09290 [Halobaculum sp. CBA1158]